VSSRASKTATTPSLPIALHSSHKGGSLELGFVGSGSSWPSISIQTLERKRRGVTPVPVGENHVTVGGRKWVSRRWVFFFFFGRGDGFCVLILNLFIYLFKKKKRRRRRESRDDRRETGYGGV
jgi:hypothetical protein